MRDEKWRECFSLLPANFAGKKFRYIPWQNRNRFAIELMLIRRSAKIKRSGFLHSRNCGKTDGIGSNQWRIGMKPVCGKLFDLLDLREPERFDNFWKVVKFGRVQICKKLNCLCNTKLLSKFGECLFFCHEKHEKYEKTAFGMPMF